MPLRKSTPTSTLEARFSAATSFHAHRFRGRVRRRIWTAGRTAIETGSVFSLLNPPAVRSVAPVGGQTHDPFASRTGSGERMRCPVIVLGLTASAGIAKPADPEEIEVQTSLARPEPLCCRSTSRREADGWQRRGAVRPARPADGLQGGGQLARRPHRQGCVGGGRKHLAGEPQALDKLRQAGPSRRMHLGRPPLCRASAGTETWPGWRHCQIRSEAAAGGTAAAVENAARRLFAGRGADEGQHGTPAGMVGLANPRSC